MTAPKRTVGANRAPLRAAVGDPAPAQGRAVGSSRVERLRPGASWQRLRARDHERLLVAEVVAVIAAGQAVPCAEARHRAGQAVSVQTRRRADFGVSPVAGDVADEAGDAGDLGGGPPAVLLAGHERPDTAGVVDVAA